ncbi:IST1 homolog [Selaginella moellendorffii]|uniref:IST1 homolog n=1 Tax=Selaginella moellendorffii TaxID=88036 RepID=UPI000D1CFD6E|nr:IST1 homolog [Selaginella moellendorffii]|eukprot:XP_002986780.2 IST1 homolog [Selaginella moellendorffii]
MLGKGFKSSKCKTLLKLATSRIKLLRNKRDIQVKQMRRDIAQMLGTGQEPSARIRVEHVIREQNIMDAYDMVELFAELIVVRLPVIDGQKTCPADLKESIASLIFAAARCADLPELADIKSCFALKYGKEFVAAAAELRPTCGVSRRIIEKMSVRAPSGETKLKVLKEIATEYGVVWDPRDTEAELLSQPEDLLDGPHKFQSATEMPRPRSDPPPKPVMNTKASTFTNPSMFVNSRASITPRSSFPQENHAHSTMNGPGTPAYKDVAAAAQAAADSAEQAAAAARAVANLATRQVLQGLSEQILNAVPCDEETSPRSYKLRDYLSGAANELDDSPVSIFNGRTRHSTSELFRDHGGSSPDDHDDLTARFQALKSRRC